MDDRGVIAEFTEPHLRIAGNVQGELQANFLKPDHGVVGRQSRPGAGERRVGAKDGVGVLGDDKLVLDPHFRPTAVKVVVDRARPTLGPLPLTR